MRNVLSSHAEVAHIWAAQSQTSGRSSDGRMLFSGPDIFSYGYHFTLGRVMVAPAPGITGIVLLNSDRYSVSTGKHQSLTWRAVSHYTCYAVPDLTELAKDLSALGKARLIHVAGTGPDGSGGGWRDETKAETRKREREAMRAYLYQHPAIAPDAAGYLLSLVGLKAGEFAAIVAKRARADAKAKADAAAREHAQNLGLARLFLSGSDGLEGFKRTLRAAGLRLYRTRFRYGEYKLEKSGALLDECADLLAAHKAAKAAGWAAPKVARLWAMLKAARAEVAWRVERFEVSERLKARRDTIRTFRDYAARHAAGTLQGYEYGTFAARARELASGLPDATPMGRARAARLADVAQQAEAIREQVEAREAAAREERERARRIEQAERDAAARAARFYGVDVDGRAYIRAVDVARDESGAIVAGEIETSQGARVPLPHAVRAFRFLKLCHDKGQGWNANGRTLPVGHYKVSAIEPDGSFTAGCHRIGWGEVERVALQLGIFAAPADESALVETH